MERDGKESREERVYFEIILFFFFSLILLRARSVSERCLFDNFFSFFYEFYSCVSLSLSWLHGIDENFVRVYYFLKLVDARYREVLSRDIPVSSCCKLMM